MRGKMANERAPCLGGKFHGQIKLSLSDDLRDNNTQVLCFRNSTKMALLLR